MWDGVHELALDGLSLQAGDRLRVTAQARDGSPWRQLGESRTLVLRVPTAEEQRVLARSLADSLMARAAAIATAERDLQRSTSDAARSRELQSNARESQNSASSSGAAQQQGNRGAMSYESAEKMRSTSRSSSASSARAWRTSRTGAKELEQRLSDAGAMDKELAARVSTTCSACCARR